MSASTKPRRRRPHGWGRRLSACKVRSLVRLGQEWQWAADFERWVVMGVWRAEGRVALAPEGLPIAKVYRTFAELGRDYRLVGDGK